jgi:hypothetical protein
VSRAADIQALAELAGELGYAIAPLPPPIDAERAVGALAACIHTTVKQGTGSLANCVMRWRHGARSFEATRRAAYAATAGLHPGELVSICYAGEWHRTTAALAPALVGRFDTSKVDHTGDKPTTNGAPIPRLPRTPRVRAA